MAHHGEPMDVDMDSDFDNKENSYHHSNVLPCTEKGYEELDVSELNMKLRYSITPAASPMSKSYTAYVDNKNLEDDSLNYSNENANLTRSLNSTMTNNDGVIKSLKTLPLQTIPKDQIVDSRGSILRQLDSTIPGNNVTVTISTNDINENLSLPSSSSSAAHTPEATTPTNITKNDEGSPIIRGLKSVLNMFRSSQSPIPPAENDSSIKQEDRPLDETYCEDQKPPTLASTPISAHRSRDGSSKRSSPLKDSIVFNDDLEKELQWKDETILFSEEKIPIHKLFLTQNKPAPAKETPLKDQKVVDNLDNTAVSTDVSRNNFLMDHTLTETHESDGEFVDCETTFSKNESLNVASKDKIQKDDTNATTNVTNLNIEKTENDQIDIPHTLNITRENVDETQFTEDAAKKVNQNLSLSEYAVTLDVTKDIFDNVSAENDKLSSNKNILEEASDAVKALEVTKKQTCENISVNENQNSICSEIQKQPSANTLKLLDVTMEIQSENVPVVNECGLSETEEHPVVPDSVIAADNTPKSIELSTEVTSHQKVDAVNLIATSNTHANVEDTCQNESTKEAIPTGNLSASNEIDQAEKNVEVVKEDTKPDGEINVTRLIENEKTVCREILETQNASKNPEKELPDNIKKIESFTNENKDLQVQGGKIEAVANTDCTGQNLVLCPSENMAINKLTINETLASENYTQIDEQVHLSHDYVALTKDIPKDVPDAQCYFLAEEQSDVLLPNNDDFDIDLEPHKVENIQALPPDVLETVKAESKLDVSETLDQFLNDTNTIENATKGLPTSEIQNILNETDYIVNSLTEIIGESQNNTIVQPESMFNESQDYQMEGVECADETLVLPDLVNQTVHNMSVDCEIGPDAINQSQSEPNTETILGTIPVATEENKAISETLGTSLANTTEQSNDFIRANKEHTDTILEPNSSMESAPIAHIGSKNEIDKKVLDVEILPNAEAPTVDEEIVLSENNSPYVSVIAETEKTTDESFEKIDIPLNTTNDAPPSPPIKSKGYNFNFDEMDDPFATKTKIRLSPPTPRKLIESDNEEKIISGSSKKAAFNRRRSQPPERKRSTLLKKKFNSTFDAGSVTDSLNIKSNDQNSEGKSNNVSVDTKNTTVTINHEVDKEVAVILESTQVLDKMDEENVEVQDNVLHNDELEAKVTSASDMAVEINAENKSSVESTSIASSDVKTSSSEQSTYYSTAASSNDSFHSKNVFNLPEIDDKNFNPFATKSKMRKSPPLDFECEDPFATKSKMRLSPDSSIVVSPNIENAQIITQNIEKKDAEDKMDTELMEKDCSYNTSNITSVSIATENKIITTPEVNTEDEDTEEGPFLEAEDAIEKLLVIENDDMMQFNEIPAQAAVENADGGELFIDAEAFEFLLNQNKSNVVADSGKESLFLKFDPLFAKRISSGGVLAALNNVQKRQSTPTKPTRPSLRNEASPIAGPSTLNATHEEETNVTQDSIDDLNITVAKPMMVVTPAVNPAVTPRNKTTTPPRSNRRSITFTSPAMAVIDRLLSLSGNNSLLGQNTTVTQANREHIEPDLALTQLRELLAEKEISVYQLRSESKELKDRLSVMETQVKILEADGKERLDKVNDLNARLAEKTKINKSMAAVVEEYERTIASLIAETEQDKKRHAEERIRLINERDEQTAHLSSMEVSFSDLHSKYEKSKQMILSCKANEETCKKSIKDFEENLTKMQTNYEMLKQHATSKLNHANQELQKMNKTHETEVLKLNAMIKRKEMHITSLEETLAQKTKANEELTAICDELINKVG